MQTIPINGLSDHSDTDTACYFMPPFTRDFLSDFRSIRKLDRSNLLRIKGYIDDALIGNWQEE